MIRALVTGTSGFIAGHLAERLHRQGVWVRGVDNVPPRYGAIQVDEQEILDLRRWPDALQATRGIDTVYMLAADMGGMGRIQSGADAEILTNNALINLHTLEAARLNGVRRVFLSSSACIYPEHLQERLVDTPLKERDAYPAQPQDTYGWEKLLSEIACGAYRKQYGLEVRIARFHNVYGPRTAWTGGREKAPAAAMRKAAMVKLGAAHTSTVEVWGDGKALRSYMHIDDCVEGIIRLMGSCYEGPLNLGSEEVISVDGLHELAAHIAGVRITIKHVPGPQGVRARNSDNTLCQQVLGWSPHTSLEEGLRKTYPWIEEQVREARRRGELEGPRVTGSAQLDQQDRALRKSPASTQTLREWPMIKEQFEQGLTEHAERPASQRIEEVLAPVWAPPQGDKP